MGVIHRDLSIHIEMVLWVTFWQPFMYQPKMGIVKTRKLSVRPKMILFSKTVQDYGNRSAAGSWAGRAFSLYAIAKISMGWYGPLARVDFFTVVALIICEFLQSCWTSHILVKVWLHENEKFFASTGNRGREVERTIGLGSNPAERSQRPSCQNFYGPGKIIFGCDVDSSKVVTPNATLPKSCLVTVITNQKLKLAKKIPWSVQDWLKFDCCQPSTKTCPRLGPPQ